jgi:hypothetical protein
MRALQESIRPFISLPKLLIRYHLNFVWGGEVKCWCIFINHKFCFAVGIALGCGLDDRGSWVPFPVGAGNFSLHHRVQTGSGVHPASYLMGTTGSFPGVKQPGREAEHSPPSSAEVKE